MTSLNSSETVLEFYACLSGIMLEKYSCSASRLCDVEGHIFSGSLTEEILIQMVVVSNLSCH
jgi:hypothetical protein